jgi:hypothetical protein
VRKGETAAVRAVLPKDARRRARRVLARRFVWVETRSRFVR